nr:LYR motif-containing protein 4 isoform X1 [Misgurnus anguillicaudatus]
MAASSRTQVLSLYRLLLKESKKFPSYNYRTYALRRVRDAFRENQTVEDPQVLEALLTRARDSLALIQRQTTKSQLLSFAMWSQRRLGLQKDGELALKVSHPTGPGEKSLIRSASLLHAISF